MLLSRGVSLVGYADLSATNPAARDGLPRAIAMALALEAAVVEGIRDGRRAEFRAEMNRTSELLKALYREVVDLFAARGLRAVRAEELPGYGDRDRLTARVSFKTAATLAGLGWIGKCGLLITPQYGSAVRLWSILTDADLPADEPIRDSRCPADCRVCTEACAAGAIYGQTWQYGELRELLDTRRCLDNGRAIASRLQLKHPTCGMCLTVCPWTRKYVRRMLRSRTA